MAATENIQTVLRKFEVDATDLSLLKKAGELLAPEMAGFVQDWYGWLQMQEEYQYFFAGNAEALGRVQRQQLEHWRSFFSGEMDERFAESRRYIGAVHARIDLPNDIYLAGVSKSTPVTPIWEGILLLPLLGIIDSARTQDIMNKSLSKIAELRAKVFVLDISGVGALDTAVANQLIKITKATRLRGCEAIISGISPAIARTVVELGVNVGEVKTTATLRDAFEIALRLVGADKRVHALAEGGM